MRGQPGFFDIDDRLRRLSDLGDQLDSSINELFFRVPEIRGRRLLIVDWA